MRTLLTSVRQLIASLRMLLIFSVLLGVAYPLLITLVAQLPGLKSRADGSLLTVHGAVTGSRLLGQAFLDAKGNPLPQYFQSRPSAAGTGYDPTNSGASNLGPESLQDTLPNPAVKGGTGKQSLLTQICGRSVAIGSLERVDGSRPYCTSDGVGAVLAVFYTGPGYRGAVTRVVSVNQACPGTPFLASYQGVAVQCATFGADYAKGQLVAIRGGAPTTPVVPADAVTASGSGLDPEISPAYARLQEARIAKVRGISAAQLDVLVRRLSKGRDLGFLGEPRVNVLQLNLALDADHPYQGK